MTRYERIEDVIALVMALQAPGPGLTIDDVQERFGVARRTAERMRDLIDRLFPDLEFDVGRDGRRYWRLTGGAVRGALRPQEREMEALAGAIRAAERTPGTIDAASLRSLFVKLETLRKSSSRPEAS